ncbi:MULTISPECIES: GntR family transcriptional regulator [unclassified Mesorhizobium]|uniref:GntR family transcriptional regulator n=1 Tax=unclassified Mesorhizobium TaxID=325217 RepID=UPI00112C90E7|nr:MULTISPECIES: GntR family transcriptional regulator [unclassified Mesorhizobium]MBZ9739789.1 GntR family transcriptional regulator [Mesorhizobium sp. CO1-1-4]MBZ9804947.1 GntR family transcriptional regulator [Mesorhizobium sp. ES1-6]TPL88692.1 GntR family transcriptional regulator [Mesorhizobium sp. B2-3-12]
MITSTQFVAEDDRQQPRLGDRVYQQIKERLIRGAHGPGDKLTVRALAEDLGVSSTPARDAINRLVLEGALVYAGPKTVIVPFLDAQALEEITLMRLALEGLAAEKAAARVSGEDIDLLRETQLRINAALDQRRYADALWSNKEFHFAIYRLCGMPHLLATIETLWLRIGASFNDLYPEFAEAKYGVHNHMAAMEGLAEGDSGAVRAAIESDIRDGYRRLKRADRERTSAQTRPD